MNCSEIREYLKIISMNSKLLDLSNLTSRLKVHVNIVHLIKMSMNKSISAAYDVTECDDFKN